jgi:ribosomal protein L16 Arg81 hydroxylase
MQGNSSLAYLIDPISVDAFFSTFWESGPLIVSRSKSTYFTALLSFSDVDRILCDSVARRPDLRIVRDGREIPIGGMGGDPEVGRELVYQQYRNGGTIVLQFLQQRWPPLANLCRGLSRELAASFQVNAYLTPAGEQGLGPHYDTHDVIVVQSFGQKRWRLFDHQPYDLPLSSQVFQKTMDPGPVAKEFVLKAGDSLYIPRGCVHEAFSDDSTSLHLTIGVHPISFGSVLLSALESVIEKDVRFRRSIPPRFVQNENERSDGETKLAELINGLKSQLEPRKLLEQATLDVLANIPIDMQSHLLDLQALANLSLSTLLKRRPGAVFKLSTSDGAIVLTFNGKQVTVPSYVALDMDYLVNAEQFCAKDLPGSLDEDGRLILVRKLLTEGFLTLA